MPRRGSLGELHGADRHVLVLAAEFVHQPQAADRAEVALDLDAEHVLERLAQMARDQVQRLLEHRAALDDVNGLAVLEAALEPLDQRAFARADRPHQVEDLTAFFAFQRRRVEIAHDLRDRFFNAEEFVGKEIVDFDGFVFVQPLDVGIAAFVDVSDAGFHHSVVKPGVR